MIYSHARLFSYGMKKIYPFLKSGNLTIVLLIFFMPLILFRDILGEKFDYLLLFFTFTLTVNLVMCLIDHIKNTSVFSLLKIGFLLFHFSLLVIAAGCIITYLTYSIGYVEIAEGHRFTDMPQNYTDWHQRFGERDGTGIKIYLENIILEFWENGQIKEFKNIIIIQDGPKQKEAIINVNGSVKYKGLLINMARYYGLAPFFTLITPQGETNGSVTINNDNKQQEFRIPEIGDRAIASYANVNDKEITVTIPTDKHLIIKKLKVGDVVEIGTKKLKLVKLVVWNGLTVVRDSGKSITYTGYVLFIVGLALYYVKKFSTITI